MRRATAVRLPIGLIAGKEIIREDENRSYLKVTDKLKVSRVNVWGNVTRKYVSDKGFGALTLDDFTAAIDASFFKENVSLIGDIRPGNVVEVIGRPRLNQNNEVNIFAESIRKIGFREEMLRRVENAKNASNLDAIKTGEDSGEEIETEEIVDFRVEKNIID